MASQLGARQLRARQHRGRPGRSAALLVASGVVDWLLIVATAVGGFYLGRITPNKRPFQLEDADISFPYTEHETVSSRNLVVATIVVPVVVILLVSLLSVPGLSVPTGTPKSLLWRRKLWELYASLLAFALGMASQWFIINGLKNICGKPRPDMLARCQPDIQNVARYVVGGIANTTSNGQLVSAAICTNTDASLLNDGFRSYPSGHSSSAAAGLGHLALFLAFKFGVVFPRAPPAALDAASAVSAFPSRLPAASLQGDAYELADLLTAARQTAASGRLPRDTQREGTGKDGAEPSPMMISGRIGAPFSARRSGAAPPLYLLVVVLVPLFGSVFIAASRWFNFRHHGFDIMFGYFVGSTTAVVSFRLYHLPLCRGAGWAWGPRSADKAFWAGVGSSSWAVPWQQWSSARSADEEEALALAGFHSQNSPRAPASRQQPDNPTRPAFGESTCVDLE
ncbi:pap2 domain containing protein [Niveomyces insectorum RCEF 264]|uniref:Pap2 domain containing protein n=1 Tax=Niveomyces insectorum RCEF 264 TaxID=1081102 RepID=A0A167U0S0_9HYPO|nr:pap2 domain containing protein [Niveomyces insectorum RCEF 264]